MLFIITVFKVPRLYRSGNYYCIDSGSEGIKFKLEVKNKILMKFEEDLFNNNFSNLETNLIHYFYNHSKKLLLYHNCYTDWLFVYFRKLKFIRMTKKKKKITLWAHIFNLKDHQI